MIISLINSGEKNVISIECLWWERDWYLLTEIFQVKYQKKIIILIKKCVYASERNENFWNQIEASVEIAYNFKEEAKK